MPDCPHCGTDVAWDATSCPRCGKRNPAERSTTSSNGMGRFEDLTGEWGMIIGALAGALLGLEEGIKAGIGFGMTLFATVVSALVGAFVGMFLGALIPLLLVGIGLYALLWLLSKL